MGGGGQNEVAENPAERVLRAVKDCPSFKYDCVEPILKGRSAVILQLSDKEARTMAMILSNPALKTKQVSDRFRPLMMRATVAASEDAVTDALGSDHNEIPDLVRRFREHDLETECVVAVQVNLSDPADKEGLDSDIAFAQETLQAKRRTQEEGEWLYVTRRGQGRSREMPNPPGYSYSGSLRPFPVSPRRLVPSYITQPDYAHDGHPEEEEDSPDQSTPPVLPKSEWAKMRAAGRLGREVLDKAHAAAKPGVTTDEIDRVVHDACVEAGAYPAPLNYYNFPKSVCTSLNEVICHGIPDQRELEKGDCLNVDVTVIKDGYHGDLNETFVIGGPDAVDEESKRLIKVTYECLEKAIQAVKPGLRFRELGDIITTHATKNKLSVVKTFCGHGIGKLFHCAPSVPHYAGNKARGVCKVGNCFTIEPMINLGTYRDQLWPDGWTATTADGKRSAQFEHTLLVTENGCEVLTRRQDSSPPLWWEV